MQLNVEIKNRVATYKEGTETPICGNTGDTIKFSFDDEWSAHEQKTARFIWGGKYHDVEFTGDTCEVPVITNTQALLVGVYVGEEPDDEPLLSSTLTTIAYTLSVRCSKATAGAGTGANYTNEAKGYAVAAAASADEAEAAAGTAKAVIEQTSATGREAIEETSKQALTDIEREKQKMLSEIALAADIVQTTGNSETAVMSQKAASNAVRKDTLNLFNKNTAFSGLYIHYLSGKVGVNAESFASDFIKIDNSKEYFITRIDSLHNHVKQSNNLQIAFYDETCAYISGLENEWKFTTPENAQYLRFGTLLTLIDKIMLSSVILTEYKPYVDNIIIDYDMIDLPVVVGKKSPNLVNPNKVKSGYYVSYTSGLHSALDRFCSTAIIKTEDNTKIYSNKNYNDGSTQCAFYDKYMTYLSGEKDVTTTGVTIPEGAEYVCITFKKTDTDIMFSFEPIYSYKQYGAYLATAEIKTLKVKLDGTGDFTNLRTCFESITDASAECQYIVEVYEGTYDIRSYYTDEEWNVENNTFIGLTIPDYVTLRGVGHREKIILTAYDVTQRTYISTINLRNTAAIENLTVKAEGLRYVVHDDYADKSQNEYVRHVENCHFIGSNLSYSKTYGAGFKQGAKATFKNCVFETDINGYSLTLHNNTGWKIPSYATFENCRFGGKGVSFGSLNTNANGVLTYLTVIGCKGESFTLCEENADEYGSGILFKATGYANDFTETEIISTDGADYSNNIDFI